MASFLDQLTSMHDVFSSYGDKISKLDDAVKVLGNMEKEVGKLSKALGDMPTDKLKTLGKNIDTLYTRIDKFWKALDDAFKPVIENLYEPISFVFTAIFRLFDVFVTWLEQNKETITGFISIVAEFIGILFIPFQALKFVLAELFLILTDFAKPLTENQSLLDLLLIAVSSLATAFLIFGAYQKAVTLITWGLTAATTAYKVAQTLLNASLLANPVTWVIGLILALIAVIGYVIYRTDGWGKQWDVVMKFVSAVAQMAWDKIYLAWLVMEHSLLTGFDNVKKAWFGLQSLWDEEGAAEGLEKMAKSQAGRVDGIKEAMAKSAISAAAYDATNLTWELSLNEKTFSDLISDAKSSVAELGLSDLFGSVRTPDLMHVGSMSGSGISAAGGLIGDEEQLSSEIVNPSNIATGGRSAYENGTVLHVGNLIENLYIEHNDFEGSVENMQEQVTDALINALRRAQVAY